jgi:Transglutaminase-like superfamily
MNLRTFLPALLLALFIATWCGAAPLPLVTAPPLGDQWFSINLNDERTGFAHQTISKRPEGYEINVDSSVKLTVLGFSREAAIRENYLVNSALVLISFDIEQTLDGSSMKLTGKVVNDGISLTVENAGTKKSSLLKSKGPVYPAAALNIYPLMKGFVPGKKYRIKALDTEAQKIKEVVVTAVGVENLPGMGETYRIRNDLYSFVDNDIWVDRQGKTLKESVRDDLVVTRAEDAAIATRFLTQTALAKKDLVFDFSLIKVDTPLTDPARLTRLTVEFSGWPEDMAFPQGAGQTITERKGRDLMVALSYPATREGTPLPDDERKRSLEGTERIIPEHPQIRALQESILKVEKDQAKGVELLVRWVAATIEGTVTDSQSPVETLQSKKGNCQSHARLYASLARSAGFPTRFVSGLVWMTDKGFLYHSWAESYVGGSWLTVDPTFGQIPADLTHIRMFDGDAPDDVAPLARVIGRLKARIVTQEYPLSPAPGTLKRADGFANGVVTPRSSLYTARTAPR